MLKSISVHSMADPMEEEEENYCYECQEEGHTNLTCPKIQCNNCNNYGHVKPRCPQLMGTTPPPGMNFDLTRNPANSQRILSTQKQILK